MAEYGADYRALPITNFPFFLCFYNTTPNAFALGLRMGHHQSESLMRWVWEANRGKPIHENASLSFSFDGNLVFSDADGSVAWQTGTANKGVEGLSLLSNGNLVLYGAEGNFIWQSFDYSTDTLLVGQVLKLNGPSTLVSRESNGSGSKGHHSLVLEHKSFSLYLTSNNSRDPLVYYKADIVLEKDETMVNLSFYSEPETEKGYAFEVGLRYSMSDSITIRDFVLSRPKYNSSYSMLRLDLDGNLRVYTYYEHVDWGAWEITFSLFGKEVGNGKSECRLSTKCWGLGICEYNQCVACPRRKGLRGWSESCSPPVLPSCSNSNGGANYSSSVGYYQDRVVHFLNWYKEGDGPMRLDQCREKRDNDCGCLGFFYNSVLLVFVGS